MIDPQELINGELTPVQVRAIEALLTTKNKTAAARKAGISRGTLWRWLKNPIFSAAIKAGLREQIQTLKHELRQHALE